VIDSIELTPNDSFEDEDLRQLEAGVLHCFVQMPGIA
jgi:hypothetical protein